MKSIFYVLEKFMLILAILCTLLLLITQFLIYDNNYTVYTSKFDIKNKFMPFSNIENNEKGVVVLKNINPNYKEIEVLLNGDFVGTFTKDDEIKIYVYDNDIIEIDGTKYNKNIHVKVIDISNNIETPKIDFTVTTSQDIEILSKVQLK